MPRPTAWFFLDQGSKPWQKNHPLFLLWGVRGEAICDPPHRRTNNRKAAIASSGLSFVRMEFAIVTQFMHGPFNSESNYQMIKAAATQFFMNYPADNELFKACYENIVHGLFDGDAPAEYGSKGHYEEIWASLPSCGLLESMGDKQVISSGANTYLRVCFS